MRVPGPRASIFARGGVAEARFEMSEMANPRMIIARFILHEPQLEKQRFLETYLEVIAGGADCEPC